MEGIPLNGNAIFQVLSTQHQHVIDVLKGYLDGPNCRVVRYACRVEASITQNILYGTPIVTNFDYFNDLVLKLCLMCYGVQIGELVLSLRECDTTTRFDRGQRTVPGILTQGIHNRLCALVLRQRGVFVGRAHHHMKHLVLKRTGSRAIRVLLFATGSPHLFGGIVDIVERRRVLFFWIIQLHAVVVVPLRHFGRYIQRTIVVLVDHRHINLIQRLRCTHTRTDEARFLAFIDLVRIGARLGVGDVAEIKRNFSTIRRPFRLRYLHTRHALVCVRRHRNINRACGGLQDKRELVGAQPSTPSENLLTRKTLLATKRT